MRYYLLNDTRYENHHGCLTVVANLIRTMNAQGAELIGSLPVGRGLETLRSDNALQKADLVVINGEGTLHHNTASSQKLLASARYALEQHKPVVLINALWQDNAPEQWRDVLEQFSAIWCRDRRSQQELIDAGFTARYAPDLTFYSDYPTRADSGKHFGLTDSVNHKLSAQLLDAQKQLADSRFLPLVLSEQPFQQQEPTARRLKRWFYPKLYRYTGLPVRPYYRCLAHGSPDSTHYMSELQQCRAVLTARYHCLCFCLQQGIPWLALSSNSHKVEALLEEIGLPSDKLLLARLPENTLALTRALEQAVQVFAAHEAQIKDFNHQAKERIAQMITQICGVVDGH